jgi:hypothetical protein
MKNEAIILIYNCGSVVKEETSFFNVQCGYQLGNLTTCSVRRSYIKDVLKLLFWTSKCECDAARAFRVMPVSIPSETPKRIRRMDER